MNRNYPTKFGQYYSTADEKDPPTPWLLLAVMLALLAFAAWVG